MTRVLVSTGLLTFVVVSARGAEPAAGAVGKVASIQNQVETKKKAEGGWSPTSLNQPLFGQDRIRTGPASRASILYSDRTIQRLGEKCEIEVLAPSTGQPGTLKVLSGTTYFSSRAPKDYGRVETPTVTAAIKGTEFVVDVAADTTTKITMLEGVVEASNSFGTLTVGRGEEAYVEPGKAPVKRIVVRPRDAVAWALYYPPVLGGRDEARLKEIGAEGEDLARAATMLSTGQVDQARPLIEGARTKRPNDAIALALASVVELAANRNDEALRLAEQAAAAAPDSAAAALAVSFAAQARNDIARARKMAEEAARLDPSSSVALARAAEMRMAEGDLEGAEGAAHEAVKRGAAEARAQAVLGFVELAQFRSEEAERTFEQSVAADPSLALAHLGLGIARIRRGRVADGREELQVASSLDPNDSLLRSYLAKALYEERLTAEAGKELATAKELDPNDPTPNLYDAIRKQNDNRPVEALEDLRESIAKNDNRAVYRSRLLLDQDNAVRGSDLARIYNDLGFEELGLVTARRSADADQANYSSHLFLAGTYRNTPGFAPAFLSEVLQARMYQPVSVNAARPDVVNESVSFNEYTALFDRPRARAFATGAYGRTNTGLEELYGSNPFFLNLVSIDRSGMYLGQGTGTLNGDRFAAAVGYQKTKDDGFRFNNDRKIANYRGFFEWAPTYRDFLQLNVLYGRQDTGDLPLRYAPAVPNLERFRTELQNYGLGYHRIFSPAADLVVSFVYNETKQTHESCPFGPPLCDPGFSPNETSTGTLEGPQIEAQQVWRVGRATWLFGVGAFRGEVRIESKTPPPPGSTALPAKLTTDDEFTNGYAYLSLRTFEPLEITVGAAAERVVSPSGLLVPRDSRTIPAELEFTRTRVSPKLGLTLSLPTHTTLRAAGYYRLSPAVGRIQTLEPTQVSGFNQFFFEPGGTRSRSFGFGLDQTFGSRVFGGFSVLKRTLLVPEARCELPDEFSACAGRVATHVALRDSHNVDASAYLNAVIYNRLTFVLDYTFRRRLFDSDSMDFLGSFEDREVTRRWRPGLRWFLPNGLFAGATATYYDQEVDKFEDLSSPERHVNHANFWVGDLTLGYRLPKRYGSVVLEAHNFSDREFETYERSVEETIIPARSVVLTLNFTY